MEAREPLRVPYKHVNKTAIPTDIYLPAEGQRNTTHELTPVIIMIHGGGFMLGHSKMNNRDQIEDGLQRGWIVLAIEHRLCPGVNVLEGPMTDVRDAFNWAQSGGLEKAIEEGGSHLRPDPERVMAMGTSAGGHLALSLAWGLTGNRPLAILDFYGAKKFDDSFWSQEIEQLKPTLPPAPSENMIQRLYDQKDLYIGGVSLEGQSNNDSATPSSDDDLVKARPAFVLNTISQGRMMETIWPDSPKAYNLIDPYLNVHEGWPPTCFVHGNADVMIPTRLSHDMQARLKEKGVETEFFEVEGEGHTFAGKMVKGSKTWDTQRKGFDFLDQVLERSYQKR